MKFQKKQKVNLENGIRVIETQSSSHGLIND